MVSDFVHQDIPEVKPMQPIQVSPSKRIGMKKYTTPPVMTVEGGGTTITLQLFSRSRQNENSPEPFEKLCWAIPQLCFDLSCSTRTDEAVQRLKLDDFRKFRIFGDSAVKTLEDRLN